VESYSTQFSRLIELHRQVSPVHQALGRLHPIAIVDEDVFLVFDLKPGEEIYSYQKQIPLPMPVPEGVRAAFPLEDYQGKMACVVTPSVFDSLEGYVCILHEFVHCYQFETCEQDLKMTLDVARHAQETGNFMWEIEHPFPYQTLEFDRSYENLLCGIREKDRSLISEAHQGLRDYLGRHDFEYMIWQEWKEGFARWVENRVKRKIGLPENIKGSEPPYSRVSFYAGGEALIQYLWAVDKTIIDDLRVLFKEMITL